jgi:hypothetical protein
VHTDQPLPVLLAPSSLKPQLKILGALEVLVHKRLHINECICYILNHFFHTMLISNIDFSWLPKWKHRGSVPIWKLTNIATKMAANNYETLKVVYQIIRLEQHWFVVECLWIWKKYNLSTRKILAWKAFTLKRIITYIYPWNLKNKTSLIVMTLSTHLKIQKWKWKNNVY